jgi:hypothetical protein
MNSFRISCGNFFRYVFTLSLEAGLQGQAGAEEPPDQGQKGHHEERRSLQEAAGPSLHQIIAVDEVQASPGEQVPEQVLKLRLILALFSCCPSQYSIII